MVIFLFGFEVMFESSQIIRCIIFCLESKHTLWHSTFVVFRENELPQLLRINSPR
eukprot:UN21765